jgi:hypothetical protein
LPFLVAIGGLMGLIIGLILAIFFQALPSVGEFVKKIINPEELLGAALGFLGVTHSTPTWFDLTYTTIGGLTTLGGIVAGALGGAKAGFWVSIIGLGLAVGMTMAGYSAKVGYEYERSWADSDEKRERLDNQHKSTLFYLLVGKFAAFIITSVGLGFSVAQGGLGWILSIIAWSIAMVGFVAGAMDLAWWGGAHVG